MKTNNNFGKNLKAIREKQKLSQRQLATLLQTHGIKVSKSTIMNYECGKTLPRKTTIMKIAIALDVEYDELCLFNN